MSWSELLYRKRFSAFADFAFRELYPDEFLFENWHLDLFCELLQFQYEHTNHPEVGKLIINAPPGFLKTHLCSVFFPAWVLGRDPRRCVLIISENLGLAQDLQERCIELMSTPRFRSLFPRAKIKSRGKTVEFQYGGSLHHSGIHYTGIRQKSDLVVIDNPQSLQSLDRLDPPTLVELPRLLKSRDEGLMVMNTRRLTEDDLTAHLERLPGWMTVALPLVAPTNQTFEFPPIVKHTVTQGEPLHSGVMDWPQIEQSFHEMGWDAFSFQQMQGVMNLDEYDRTYHNTEDTMDFKWMVVGEASDDFRAIQHLKKLREYDKQKSGKRLD